MAGLEMRFSLNDAELERQLQALVDRGGNLEPAFDDIGQDMVAITLRAFEQSKSPEGVPWQPSAAAVAEGRKTLIKTTNLRGGFSYITSPTGVVYGTNVPYAAIHQTGGSFAHAGKAKGADAGTGFGAVLAESLVTIPARPFVGASDTDVRRWENTMRDYLAPGGAA